MSGEKQSLEPGSNMQLGLNVNTIICALILAGVLYMGKLVAETNEKVIRLDTQFSMFTLQLERRVTDLENQIRSIK